MTGISAPGPWVAKLEADGVRHRASRSSTRGWSLTADLRAAVELWRILRAERFDVLHTHNPKPGIYGRIVGRLAGVPRVVNTNHGLYAIEGPGLRSALVLAAEGVDGPVLARRAAAERGGHGPPGPLAADGGPRRTRLLGNGVDLARFRPPADAAEPGPAPAPLGVPPGAGRGR